MGRGVLTSLEDRVPEMGSTNLFIITRTLIVTLFVIGDSVLSIARVTVTAKGLKTGKFVTCNSRFYNTWVSNMM